MANLSETAQGAVQGGLGAMSGGASLDHLPFGLGDMLTPWLEGLAAWIDLIGVSIIIFGFLVALVQLTRSLVRGAGLRREMAGLDMARVTLATYILTGLEFMIASDIVHTVISREVADLLFVALLVVIRTAISYFLGREATELRREEMGGGADKQGARPSA